MWPGGDSAENSSKPWQSYHTVYTNAKAGMDGVDKEKVQRIVYEMSKGSKYFENEERKEADMRQKVESMRARCAKLSAADISHHQKVAEKRIAELEATRDLSRIWLHVDMDAFYAAVETLSNPSLKGKPMAVGGMSMISTANYEARKYGVRAAMPGFIARKLCPELSFVPTDFKKYTHYSTLTRKVFHSYDPNYFAASLDEAYLDITDVCAARGATSEEIAEELRSNVFRETGLTCSAGVAPNRMLAKVCSDINKPNGQFVLPNDRMAIMAFISSLPIRKIGGIGKVTEKILREVLGISTCEDMLKTGGLLSALFSRLSADFFLCVGLGLGKTDVPEVKMRKSMSSERTFSATADEGALLQKLAELVEILAADLQKEGLHGKTVTLKLKTSSFEVRTRAVTLWKYTCSSKEILKEASKLLKAEFPISARLIGLRVSHFREDVCDHTQKSIMNFVISGDSSGNYAIDHNCLESNATADVFMVEQADDFSSINFACNSSPEGHNHQLQEDSGSERCAFNTCALECHKNDRTLGDQYEEMDYPGAASYGCVPKPHVLHGQQLASTNQKTEDEQRNTTNPSLDDASSSTHQDQLVWVDGYKCSICGIELPSVFVEERIEHFDFHLAERLQEDESGTGSNSTGHLGKPRFVEKGKSQRLSARKKHKASREKCKYLPIDIFFAKK